ncbi:LAFE_0G15346g1_1 [Lachancea fermentati]|uniref:Ureidoglycolate lyase n=1 Tax=Lachancea fermentati TaxID=4955 RepID=A0A1G4MIE1_LACFM|nr:LAFE_0G15346g1_1 [Lachancea fermentati]
MILIHAQPLTIQDFKPYGSIISPNEEVFKLDESAKNANQGTAIKIMKVSEIQNQFSEKVPVPNWNIFRCFPQHHLRRTFLESIKRPNCTVTHDIKVLEKHPYSSQTFLPMGRAEDDISYLVVVALPNPACDAPDLSTLKAFTCKGNQAVTYGAGIWHAPMIVLGTPPYLDFGVLINELLDNGHPEKDCVETFYEEGQLQITLIAANETKCQK